MRFRDGMWLLREEYKVEFAEDIHTIDVRADDSISLLCPTKHIYTRGDTLNQATITIVTPSPFPPTLPAVLTLPGPRS